MMSKLLAGVIALVMALPVVAQKKYYTKNGRVSFQAGTAVEDIDGVNPAAASVLDAATGQLEYMVLVKGFEFKRALMQEHFNKNYMESDKYPKSVFKGKITNLSSVNFSKDGTYPVTVKGILDMHGVKKEVESKGTLTVSGETIAAEASLEVALADFNIAIPGVVSDKISKTVKINISCKYNVLQ